MLSARITGLALAHDGVILVAAVCRNCQRPVTHGAGVSPDDLILGTRVAHCGCAEYVLTDVNGILPDRVAAIRGELAARAAREAAREERRSRGTRRDSHA